MPVLDGDGLPQYPSDRAAGVGILLSPTTQSKYIRIAHGSTCERICWVRIKGPVCNLFVIEVYLPHSKRINPSTPNTVEILQKLLQEVPQGDCILVMGDLNVQLPANVKPLTGKWALVDASENVDLILDMMRM